MGWGFIEKVFATINIRFWQKSERWINSITQRFASNRFSAGLIISEDKKKNIIEFLVAGDQAKRVCRWTPTHIKYDLQNYINRFDRRIKVDTVKATKWS